MLTLAFITLIFLYILGVYRTLTLYPSEIVHYDFYDPETSLPYDTPAPTHIEQIPPLKPLSLHFFYQIVLWPIPTTHLLLIHLFTKT